MLEIATNDELEEEVEQRVLDEVYKKPQEVEGEE